MEAITPILQINGKQLSVVTLGFELMQSDSKALSLIHYGQDRPLEDQSGKRCNGSGKASLPSTRKLYHNKN